MTRTVRRFRLWLAVRGMSWTRERSRVAEVVTSQTKPFDAETVYRTILQSPGECRISRATVFRTVFLLADAGIISARLVNSDSTVPMYAVAVPSWNPELCRASHRDLISGRCPWCGQQIVNGQPDL